MSSYKDDKYYFMSGNNYYRWNKKLCFQARDSLFDCIDRSENGNKYRCPDELYAYEMWCPVDFQRIQSRNRRIQQREDDMYDLDEVAILNKEKQTPFR